MADDGVDLVQGRICDEPRMEIGVVFGRQRQGHPAEHHASARREVRPPLHRAGQQSDYQIGERHQADLLGAVGRGARPARPGLGRLAQQRGDEPPRRVLAFGPRQAVEQPREEAQAFRPPARVLLAGAPQQAAPEDVLGVPLRGAGVP